MSRMFNPRCTILNSASILREFGHKLMNKNKAIASASMFGLMLGFSLLLAIKPVLAHHPLGGEIPHTFSTGFLSGLGHPVIGFDHLVFTIAIGLLAAFKNRLGAIVPVAFTIATAIGTGVHLLSIDLPLPEIVISASISIVGVLLAKENQINVAWLTIIVAIAGIFHGYAYGESIIGAETIALASYLLGFSLIQLVISAIAFYWGRLAIGSATARGAIATSTVKANISLRFAGFTICGIGITFLSNILFA